MDYWEKTNFGSNSWWSEILRQEHHAKQEASKMGTWHPINLIVCPQHQPRQLPAGARGRGWSTQVPANFPQTAAREARGAQSARAGGTAGQHSSRARHTRASLRLQGTERRGKRQRRAQPGLSAERPPGPTWCPSYLASSGSVKSRTGASAGGLKRSWGSAPAAGSSRKSRSSGSRQGSGSGARAAAPAMARSAHRPRPEAREGSGVGTELKKHRGERRGARRNSRERFQSAEGDGGA